MEFVIIFILMSICSSRSVGWCGESEYSCGDGTQCRPKADRCQQGSECHLPLPIQIPPCPQQCQVGHEFWCEKRGRCLSNIEVCDCGPGKMFCVSEESEEYSEEYSKESEEYSAEYSRESEEYSCENRRGIASSRLYSVCRDGTCSSRCTDNGRDSCREGQFKCGSACRNISQITQYRRCGGECIGSEDACYRNYSENSSSNWGSIAAVILGIVLSLPLAVFVVHKKWENIHTCYIELRKRRKNEDVEADEEGICMSTHAEDEGREGRRNLVKENSLSQEALQPTDGNIENNLEEVEEAVEADHYFSES